MPIITVRGSEGPVLTVPVTVEADPLPRGVFYKGDDMTLSNSQAISQVWGQHSEEGGGAGDPPNPGNSFEWRTADDGPLVDGVRTRYRRIYKGAQNRRNEIGQVNGDGSNGFAFAVGGEYVTLARLRVPGNIAWVGSGDNQGAIMQMKHSKNASNGGFGGNEVSSGPPIGLKTSGPNSANRMTFTERSGDYSVHDLWQHNVPHMQWFDIAFHIHYSLDGFADVYYALNGQSPQRVLQWEGPTVKENQQGQPMFSTLRFGCYDESGLDRFVDLGPVRVERLG